MLLLSTPMALKMRIIISVQSIRYPMTGIGRYTLEIASRISRYDNIEDILYYDGSRLRHVIPVPSYVENNTNKYFNIIKKIFGRYSIFVKLYKILVRFMSTNIFRYKNSYIYHGTNFYLPSFGGRKIVTIHDLSVISYPMYHPIERVNMLSDEIEISINSADAIITDSHYTKNEIISLYDIDSNNIHVVHLAHGSEFHYRSMNECNIYMDKYDIEWKKYVLFVGTIEPRKNIESLIDAFSQLDEIIKNNYKLLIVGHKGWNNNNVFEKMNTGANEGWLRYIGFVEEKDLPYIYAGAHLFVFPSFYEGFGLPVLEAMASGVPVVASTSSSIPEVCGDAAALCDPNDTNNLRDLILRGIMDDEWRAEAIKRGLKRATDFSWDKCARETYEVYKIHSG
jgi:alpha-1,3-rhamnosyl/mannosyltransferase